MKNSFFIIVTIVCTIFGASCFLFADEGVIDNIFSAPSVPVKAHYTIDCSVDISTMTMICKEVIKFTNSTEKPMRRIAMHWASNNGSIDAISTMGKQIAILDDTEPSSWRQPFLIDLPDPLLPGKVSEIHIKFTRPMGKNSHKIKLSGWHPKLWWGYGSEWGYAVHDDYDVKIDTPKGYAIATSARLDPKSGYYRGKSVRNFGIFLGKDFKAIEAEAGDVLVRCVCSEKGLPCARLLVETAKDVINFYRTRFGFYPFSSLSIIPGASSPMGGYPMATSLVVVHGLKKFKDASELHWKWITAHEIGHQYFGEYVLEKDNPGWLWIGMGIYADREYALSKGWGLKKHLGFMNCYTNGLSKGYDTTADIPTEVYHKIEFDYNNVVIHGKGYSIISALDCVLGKKTFNRIYLRCLSEYAGRRLGAHDFQKVCEEETGSSLIWFFDQWAGSNRYLLYKVVSQTCEPKGSGYASKVDVERQGTLRMPVPVKAVFEDGSEQVVFTDRILKLNRLNFDSRSPLKEVIIDPDKRLAMISSLPPMAIEKDLIKKIRALPWIGAGKKALVVFEDIKKVDIKSADTWFVLGMRLFDGKYYEEAQVAFKKAVALTKDSSQFKSMYLVWVGHIYDLQDNGRKNAIDCYEKAMKVYKGNNIRHDQYGIVINKVWLNERLKKPFTRS